MNKSPGKKQQDDNLKNADEVKETKAKAPRKIKTRKRKRSNESKVDSESDEEYINKNKNRWKRKKMKQGDNPEKKPKEDEGTLIDMNMSQEQETPNGTAVQRKKMKQGDNPEKKQKEENKLTGIDMSLEQNEENGTVPQNKDSGDHKDVTKEEHTVMEVTSTKEKDHKDVTKDHKDVTKDHQDVTKEKHTVMEVTSIKEKDEQDVTNVSGEATVDHKEEEVTVMEATGKVEDKQQSRGKKTEDDESSDEIVFIKKATTVSKRKSERRAKLKAEQRAKLQKLHSQKKSLAAKFILSESTVTYRPPQGVYGNFGVKETNEEYCSDTDLSVTQSSSLEVVMEQKAGFLSNEVIDLTSEEEGVTKNKCIIIRSDVGRCYKNGGMKTSGTIYDGQEEDYEYGYESYSSEISEVGISSSSSEDCAQYYAYPNWRQQSGSFRMVHMNGRGSHKAILDLMANGDLKDRLLLCFLKFIILSSDSDISDEFSTTEYSATSPFEDVYSNTQTQALQEKTDGVGVTKTDDEGDVMKTQTLESYITKEQDSQEKKDNGMKANFRGGSRGGIVFPEGAIYTLSDCERDAYLASKIHDEESEGEEESLPEYDSQDVEANKNGDDITKKENVTQQDDSVGEQTHERDAVADSQDVEANKNGDDITKKENVTQQDDSVGEQTHERDAVADSQDVEEKKNDDDITKTENVTQKDDSVGEQTHEMDDDADSQHVEAKKNDDDITKTEDGVKSVTKTDNVTQQDDTDAEILGENEEKVDTIYVTNGEFMNTDFKMDQCFDITQLTEIYLVEGLSIIETGDPTTQTEEGLMKTEESQAEEEEGSVIETGDPITQTEEMEEGVMETEEFKAGTEDAAKSVTKTEEGECVTITITITEDGVKSVTKEEDGVKSVMKEEEGVKSVTKGDDVKSVTKAEDGVKSVTKTEEGSTVMKVESRAGNSVMKTKECHAGTEDRVNSDENQPLSEHSDTTDSDTKTEEGSTVMKVESRAGNSVMKIKECQGTEDRVNSDENQPLSEHSDTTDSDTWVFLKIVIFKFKFKYICID